MRGGRVLADVRDAVVVCGYYLVGVLGCCADRVKGRTLPPGEEDGFLSCLDTCVLSIQVLQSKRCATSSLDTYSATCKYT